MDDGIVQLIGEELVTDSLRQVNRIKTLDGTMVPGRFLVPGQLCSLTLVPELYEHDFIQVYYISDLHLETWYDEYCKKVETPEQALPMFEWMETVMDSLFSGDFLQDIGNRRSVTVLFLGDIADTFKGSELFYKEFMRRWNEIDENNRLLFERQEAERQAARHEIDVRIIEEYKVSHPWIEQAKRPLASYKRTPDEVKAAIQRIEQWERGEKRMLNSFMNFTLHSEMFLPSWEIMRLTSLPGNPSLLWMMPVLMLPTCKESKNTKICFSLLAFIFWMLMPHPLDMEVTC